MSIAASALVYKSGLDKSEKAIALAYADHAHDDGSNIYPSIAYTSWKTGYSERSVQRITKALIKKGVIVPDGKGAKGTNKYKMIFENLPKREPFRGGDILSGGVTSTTEGVTSTTHRGDTVSPKPSVKHLIEPSITENSDFALAITAYENNIGQLTPIISEEIGHSVDEFTSSWFIDAVKIAAENNVRKLSYINGILKRWRDSGKSDAPVNSKVTLTSDGGFYV